MSSQGGDGRVGVAVLGSTGSIGRQTLNVIDEHLDHFRVVALAARAASKHFLAQVARYRPEIAAVFEWTPALASSLETAIVGDDGLVAASTHPSVDIVVVASSGHVAIVPTLRALEVGKTVALANKETLVCAGEIIAPLAAASGDVIRPIDSEHCAIWQALDGSPIEQVNRIILTASGGPFRTTPGSKLAQVTAAEALAHPTWSMGDKITVDSATLMNKGLEIIEAHWLFGLSYERIEVLIHPESVVHSLVEFIDGAQMAQLGLPDMRVPIQYALSYPERMKLSTHLLDLAQVGSLHFEPPDTERFPALRLARDAGIAGRTYPTVLSAADDEAVRAFLVGDLGFVDIPTVVEMVLERHQPSDVTLDSIWEADRWARIAAGEALRTLQSR
ncbi:MAG: 1-deoxy-D-xylulose-5-phosphate reductoisomerase [Thermomicrobiales bacterium]|nr:1-deoxy-D-xylulose-5-phosphate reductoisomerase [Thermomicrobiales bacterium]